MALFDELKKTGDINIEQILNALLNDTNIELKTQIVNPLGLTTLKTISEKLNNEKCIKCANTINTFIDWYLRYMVSWNRQSRDEIVRSVIALRVKEEKTPTVAEKLMGK